ncbi:MAG: MoaD/ThiS family protein, partial [Stellaceae bacterium]
MVRVILPAVLLRLFPDAPRELMVEAATVAAVLDALDRRWPGMKDRLCDSTPRIRRHVNIFIGTERASLDTPIPADAKL